MSFAVNRAPMFEWIHDLLLFRQFFMRIIILHQTEQVKYACQGVGATLSGTPPHFARRSVATTGLPPPRKARQRSMTSFPFFSFLHHPALFGEVADAARGAHCAELLAAHRAVVVVVRLVGEGASLQPTSLRPRRVEAELGLFGVCPHKILPLLH